MVPDLAMIMVAGWPRGWPWPWDGELGSGEGSEISGGKVYGVFQAFQMKCGELAARMGKMIYKW